MRQDRCAVWLILAACLSLGGVNGSSETPVKTASSLYPPELVACVRANTAAAPWMGEVRDQLVEAARPWMEKSDDELWSLMFGPAITRTWMVWSNGHCPSCEQSVPMYTWKMDAMGRPWKVVCPHCAKVFPTNDFKAFYDSGLNEHGVFDPALADRSLLYNGEHPDPNDPLHGFGVDDGEGFVHGDNRWRFIGAYLIYGQFKQAVLGGIRILSAAYLMTGEPAFAHKAGVLLDRVADVYPGFDFETQGLVYEKPGVAGYVSTWHDTCEETRELVMSYDMIFPALREDAALVEFLARKAREFKIENPKSSFADIQRNIEDRILRDALANKPKIHSNYPRTEVAIAIILTVLGREQNRDAFNEVVDAMMAKATAVDGVTGEKGLAGYASFTVQAVGLFLAEFAKTDPQFVADWLRRQPRLRETFRFHIDTLCLDRYYPQTGDTGGFGVDGAVYSGMNFLKPGYAPGSFSSWTLTPPSSYTLLWRLYEQTGDPAYVQIAWRANGKTLDGMPHDLYADDPEGIRKGMEEVLTKEGTDLRLASINKREWCLAILRGGEGENARAVWLDYDSGGGHGHHDGMNLGLFARGLDLMPEFGYPPVQFGGWGSERAVWYTKSAAHNTVVVDGKDTPGGSGIASMWGDGKWIHAVRAAAPALNGDNRYERTVLLVDVSPEACYVIEVFRVEGGSEHTKFMHSHFGTVQTTGLNVSASPDYGRGTQMRNFQLDAAAAPGWQADWSIEDRLDLLPEGAEVHLRYTDLTRGAAAGTCEAWLVAGGYNETDEVWIPRIIVQRKAVDGQTLKSAFVGVIEPYAHTPAIEKIERLPLSGTDGQPLGDPHVGLAIMLADGRRDVVILRDPATEAAKAGTAAPAIVSDAEMVFVRLDPDGTAAYSAICNGSGVMVAGKEHTLPQSGDFAEWE